MPKQDSIDLVKLFKFSYGQFSKYASFVIGAMLTYVVLAVIPQVYFMMNVPQTPTTQSQVVSFVLTCVQMFLAIGFIKIMLRLVQDEFVEVIDMFNNFGAFLSYFVGTFIYYLAVGLGLLLLVLPGIFIAIRLQFYPYFILEENVSSFTAMQKSYYLTEGLTIELFLLGVAVIALNIAGIFLFGIGVIFTYPLTTMATAVVYKSLSEGGESIPAEQYQP